MKLRWGIIGCGDVAENKGGPALYQVEGSQLIAVMRRDVEKARDFAQRHGAKRYYRTVEELLKDEEINAVYVATPPYLHCEQTIKTAESGKHILCEKPMAMNPSECYKMIDACRQNNVKLMMAYYRRCYPNVLKMKEFLQDGAIGEPMLAKVSLTGYYNPQNGAWRIQPEISGGGVLMDVGSHRLDVLIFLLGDVEEVCAYTETLRFDYEVDDSALLLLQFKNGTRGVANFNWNTGTGMDAIEIHGTEGKLVAEPLGTGNLALYQRGADVKQFTLPPTKITHQGLVENFVAALNENAPLICPGEEGLKTNLIMDAAYQSSRAKCCQKI